jgi:hypothetical protein
MMGEGESRRPRDFEKLNWPQLFAVLGLDSEKIDRLNRILVAHLLVATGC